MDDAFDRLVEREDEIRRRLARGDITDDEAEALRELVGDEPVTAPGHEKRHSSGGLRLDLEQLRRIVDDGVSIESLRAVLDVAPEAPIDDAIDLAAEFEPCPDDLARIARVRRATADQLRRLLENELDADAIEAAAGYGLDDPVDAAITLVEAGADVASLLSALDHEGVTGLDLAQLQQVVDDEVDPRAVGEMLDACSDLPFATVLRLCVDDADPGAIRRLREQGIEVDVDAVSPRKAAITLGLNLNLGRRHLLVGAGRERIRRSGRVDGFYVGDVTIDPGLQIEFAATLVGNLHVGRAADVHITGRITGEVSHDDQTTAPTGA